jgi:hypothetical protein
MINDAVFRKLLGKTTAIATIASMVAFGSLVVTNFADAGTGIGATPNFPSSVTVGDTNVAVSLDITNNSSSDVGALTLDNIYLTPQCGDPSIPCSSPDPGVFSVSATGTGAGACSANTFTIATVDASTGRVQFTPNSTISLALGATCTINFTVNVLKAPTVDASGAAGIQTAQGSQVTAHDTATGLLPASGTGSDITTVSKLSPGITTTPNPTSGSIGTELNDTATLTGGSTPTGNVTFKLFPPSDATCQGTPVFTQVDGSSPYTTGPGYTSLVTGTYHWTADYAGDANNNAASSACSDESVVISGNPSTITSISSSAATVSAGGTITLTVTEQNDGDVNLTDADVVVDNGVGTLNSSAANFSGDDGDNILEPGETWTWTVDVTVNADTTYTATGHGMDPTDTDITYPGDQDEQASVTVNVRVVQYCSPGYWKQSQHFDSWVGYTPTQTFSSVFGTNVTIMWSSKGKPAPVSNPTLLQALQANGGGVNALARAAVDALLNSTSMDSGLTSSQVISIFDTAISTGTNAAYQDAINQFTAAENCPLN